MTDGLNQQLGRQIQRLRKAMGMTQLDLAYASRLSPEHIGKVPLCQVSCRLTQGDSTATEEDATPTISPLPPKAGSFWFGSAKSRFKV